MSRRVDLPSEDHVRRTMADLAGEALAAGTRPTVLGLARRLRLTNTTFWRHFPDIADEVSANASRPGGVTSPNRGRSGDLERQNATLRSANNHLTEHLDLAIANIQRLTLDNHWLRQELESPTKITKIDTKARKR